MHDVDLSLEQEPPQPQEPPHVGRAARAETRDRDTLGLDVGDEGVLVRQQVGDVVGEGAVVTLAHLRCDEHFSSASTETLDQTEDPNGSIVRGPATLTSHDLRYSSHRPNC